jgi:hypothetical protein
MEQAVKLAQAGEPAEAMLKVATDPWLIGSTLLATPFSAAFAASRAGIATKPLGSLLFSRIGASALASEYTVGLAAEPVMHQIGDELVDHPWISLGLQVTTGIFGYGPATDHLIKQSLKAFPNAPKHAARKYATYLTERAVKDGRVLKSAVPELSKVVDDVVKAADALAVYDGKTIRRMTDAELMAKSLVVDTESIQAAERMIKRSEESLKTLATDTELAKRNWEAAESAARANVTPQLRSRLQRKAAEAKNAYLDLKLDMDREAVVLKQTTRDIDILKNGEKALEAATETDVPLKGGESMMPSLVKDGAIDKQTILEEIGGIESIPTGKEEIFWSALEQAKEQGVLDQEFLDAVVMKIRGEI